MDILGLIYESTTDFIQREFTLTVFFVGLIIGGVGLWSGKKVGWMANQMTGVHIVLSVVIGIIITNNKEEISDNRTSTYILSILVLIIVARLFWTNATMVR